MVEHNRRRALADVVTVEAWHDGFSQRVEKADIHVDVVFMTGRIGGGVGDEVRFQMALRRAEVVVVIPPGEPARVDPRSVSRDAPEPQAKATETRRSNRKGKVGGRLGGKAGPKGAALDVGLDLSGEAGASRETHMAITRQIKAMTLIHSQTADGEHRWSLTPNFQDTLDGRPWDSATQPRLAVVDQRPDRTRGLAPTTRVEVRCRREDLEITDIALKDDKAWNAILVGPNHRNKVVAAEALIRTRLFEEGLFSGELDDPYAQMTLAVVVAESV